MIHIEQIEKLQHLANDLVERYRELRFRYISLQRENAELKEKIEKSKGEIASPNSQVDALKKENKKLKQKHQTVRSQLTELMTELQNSQTKFSGVDS